MKRIFFTLSFLMLFGVAVSAQINFVTSGGPIGTDVNYAMDGYTGDKSTSGSGTATYLRYPLIIVRTSESSMSVIQ